MKNFKLLFWGLATLSILMVGCKDPDPNPVSYVEDGFYVTGAATTVADLFADNAEVALMAVGINEDGATPADQHKPRQGMYEKYVALEGGKTFVLMQKAGAKETQFGATLQKVNIAGTDNDGNIVSVNEQPIIEIYKGTLTENGAALQVETSGLYHIIVDVPLNTVVIAPVEWGVRGAMNGWSFTKFPQPAFNSTAMTYTLTDVEVPLNGAFKFAYGGGWKLEIGTDVKAETNLGKNADNALTPGGGNISIERAKYSIVLNWKLAKGDVKNSFTVTVTKTGDLEPLPEYPDNLYVVGDGSLAGWQPGNGVALYPVKEIMGMFYGVVWLNATGAFKFVPQNERDNWNGDFGKAPVNITDYAEFGTGSGDGGANDIPVPGTAGYYVIFVDMDKDLISVVEPKIYAIGNAYGAWDASIPANIFTVNNTADPDNATITSPAATNDGNFRAHIKHEWVSDWWRAEVCGDGSGGIVYKNNPPDVPVTVGQKVVFNFNKGTSKVE